MKKVSLLIVLFLTFTQINFARIFGDSSNTNTFSYISYPQEVNPCSFITCQYGYQCFNGFCSPSMVQSNQNCWPQCQYDQTCFNNRCLRISLIDKCASIKCRPNQYCVNGVCFNNFNQCRYIRCSDGYICVSGKCVLENNLCRDVKCQYGFYCFEGRCLKYFSGTSYYQCNKNTQCANGFKCKEGNCIEVCSDIICPEGFVCIKGKCQNISCDKITCPSNTYCSNGKCVSDLTICPAGQTQAIYNCFDPRPNEQNCPQKTNNSSQQFAFCGVRSDGSRVSFSQQCSVCKNVDIIYYSKSRCENAAFLCKPDQSCNSYYCSSYCLNDNDCPQSWQTCIQGKCIDKCYNIRCLNGKRCKFGKCD